MGSSIQARLDDETKAVLQRLVQRTGLSASEVVRQGIHLRAKEADANEPMEIIGLGKYDFGVTDLATNKKHLAGLGLSSLPSGKLRRKSIVR
jgi:hypothetical protein